MSPADRNRVSRLRQALAERRGELVRLLRVFFDRHPLRRGSLYVLRRKCGKPSCACSTRGQLHATVVLSWSEGGRTRLRAVPSAERASLRALTARYQRFRTARARLVRLQAAMLDLVDQIEQALQKGG